MDALLIDPVLSRGCAAAVAVLLLVGGGQKLLNLPVFEAVVELYEVLPRALAPLFARLFPLLEILAGALVLLAPGAIGGGAAVAVLLLASAGILVNLLRGRRNIDCGCGGGDSHPRLSWALLGRNAVLLLAAAIAGLAVSARELVWIDYLTVVALALALLGLYAATNQLLANQPRYQALRS